VLHAIDQALTIRERHPTLFAAQLRLGERTGRDRDCLQLARALDRYKRRREPIGAGRWDDPEASRVDPEWEEKQARKREERWADPTPNAVDGALPHHRAETKPDLDRDRRSLRAGLDVDVLYRLALARAAAISTVRASNIAASSAGSGHPSKLLGEEGDLSGAQLIQDDPAWDRRWDVVKRGLLLVHDLLDEHEGLGVRSTDQTSEALSMLVLTEGRGLSCKEAAARFPEATQGGRSSVVAQIRRNQGSGLDGRNEAGELVAQRLDLLGYKVNVSDGERQMDTEAAGVRRVVIDP